MNKELNPTHEETAALDRIADELKFPGATATTHFDRGELCKKYQQLKGSLKILVEFVKKIPGIGAKVAAALEFLMTLADLACPV